MANWRDTILKNFKPKISRLTLVADPDGLLTEEGMLTAIRDRGFDLIPFDDPIAFRFAYESQYRSRWDQGPKHRLGCGSAFRRTAVEQAALRFAQGGTAVDVRSPPVVPEAELPGDRRAGSQYLDAVDEAYQKHDGDLLTERATKDFVLMQCFGIVPKLIKKPVDLLKVLLSLHSRKVRLPDFLVEYLLESLTKDAAFETWPLGDILPSRESFLRFLQDEWKLFLASQSDSKSSAGFHSATRTCGPTSTRSSSTAR